MDVQYPFRKYERKPFDADGCTRCGRCLSECPVMHLPAAEAKAEIASLIRCLQDPDYTRPSTNAVLRACASCFACNLVCPNDCRPANLFLDTWYREYKRHGLPERARYFLPHSRPNFRTYAIERLSAEERNAIASWASLEPTGTFFYPGCNFITTPYLAFSRLFEGLPIRGGLDYCCGEAYFRMGLYDQLEQAARKCTAYFRTLGAKTVYLACTADLNMFTHVLPQFGGDFSGISFVPLLAHLHGKLESGEIPVVNRFDGKTATIQDSCHAKIYEADYHEWPRKILALLGFEIREAPQHAQTALCCGIGSGCSHEAAYAKTAIVAGQRACVRNLRAGKADYVCVYCSGCLEMLAASRFGGSVYHVLESIQEAIGEKPARKHRGVALNIFVGVARNQGGGPGRFSVPPIE